MKLRRKNLRVIALSLILSFLKIFLSEKNEDRILQPLRVPVSITGPCDSARSLSSFLNQNRNSTHYFSKLNPICPFSVYNHFHIAIPFYNLDEKTLKESIQSVTGQRYPKEKITIWVYDDASNLPTSKQALINSCGNSEIIDFPVPMGAGTSRAHTQIGLNAANLPKILCFQATEHLGPGGGKYWLFEIIKLLAKPNEVVLVLDGDDTLLHPQSLAVVNQKYIDTSSWFTYGSYEGRWSDQVVDLPPSVRNGVQKFKPREQIWLYGHPRTFKAHLLDHITQHDFQFSDGNWLTKDTDRGFVYRMMELSGPARIGYISTHVYKYEFSELSSTLSQVSKKMRNAQVSHTMKMEPSNQLNLDVHVVLLVWKRIYLLRHQLSWLQDQIGLKNRRVHVHVVNNNQEEQDMVNGILKNFRISQLQDQVKSLSMLVTVKHNTGTIYHNFERFIYVEQLCNTVPLDEVIFLDDDQYWQPNFLSNLLKEHKPKGMTTWYGKTFVKDPSSGYASYWKPTITMTDIERGSHWPSLVSFKYGGTGGSIFDTNLWLLDSQLMRLCKGLSGWAKVDDLWASYVLDALLGWEIRRLTPPNMPIDIGRYHESEDYNRTVTKRISHLVQRELMGLQSQPGAQRIRKSATFLDPTVDKQNMFEALQTEFMWDLEKSRKSSPSDLQIPLNSLLDLHDTILEGAAIPFREISYAFTRESSASYANVTLITHMSTDKLPRLLNLIERWNGPISCSVYLPTKASIRELYFFVQHQGQNFCKLVTLHLILEKSVPQLAYPMNRMRNLALENMETEYFFFVDIDFVPSEGSYEYLTSFISKNNDPMRFSTLYVIPAFEAVSSAESVASTYTTSIDKIPRTKEDLLALVSLKQAQGFHLDFFPHGHGSTDYERWYHCNEGEAYQISFHYMFEPYVVGTRYGMHRFDDRYRGFGGGNKFGWINEANLRKYRFEVLCGAFVVHQNHPGRSSRQIAKGRNFRYGTRPYTGATGSNGEAHVVAGVGVMAFARMALAALWLGGAEPLTSIARSDRGDICQPLQLYCVHTRMTTQ